MRIEEQQKNKCRCNEFRKDVPIVVEDFGHCKILQTNKNI